MTANVVHPAELERMLQARVAETRSKRADRAAPRKRSSGRRFGRGSSALVVGIVLALSATAAFADSGALDVQVGDSTEYAFDTTTDDAIVEYIGKDNEDFGSSGTGVINSFLQTQDTPSEEGYNTNGTRQFDTGSSPTFNRAILVSEIPVVECEALDPLVSDPAETGLCWELFADINDSNANDPDAAQIQLTELEIWLTANANLTGYVQADDGFPSGATEVYDFEGTILINDVNSGSGRGDLRYLVPLTEVNLASLAPNCQYGSTTCATYFVVYTEWGDTEGGDYISDSGFEEWTVKRYPFLSVSKTATTTFTRTFGWTIDKSADPAAWALFDGDSGTSDWTVAVTKDNGVDSAWAVSGTITIDNPSDQDAVIASVTDGLTGGLNASVTCGVTFPYTLDEGDTLNCTYSRSLPDGTSRTNTATATLSTGPVFTGTAAVTFGAPTTVVNGTVDVTDTNGQSWDDVADDASFTYDETFECPDDAGTHNNTATITQTGQFDSASVTVTCYDLDVTKTAVESFSRDFDWTIEKSVDPTSLDLFDGDSDDVTWTVEWTKSAAQDSTYAVTGTITIDNNHPSLGAVINSVSDVITTSITADVDCGVGVTFPHTIPAGGSLVCTYSSDLPDGTTRTNTATATQQHYDYASDLTATAAGTTDYSDTESVDFTGVTPTVTDDTATLSDARTGNTINGDPVSTSGSTTWDEAFECGEDDGDHTNTATVTEDDSLDDDSDDATVTVNCYELTVTKDAATTYSRDYDWDIAKTRFIATDEDDGDGDPLTLTLDEGQTYTANYEVTVTMTGYTDDDHAVSGTITINNPAPMDAVDVVVTDVISHAVDADILATVDCDGDATVTVPAEDSVDCSYSADLDDADDRLNTATATLFGIGYDGSANVTFDLTNPTEQIDECVDITDDAGTPLDVSDDIDLGTVCVDDLDGNNQWSDEYTMDIGPFAVCGVSTFTNRVTFVATNDTNDTGETDWAEYTVTIDIPCPTGCTLTQGYWKTHNETFWGGAPADETWFLLGNVDGDLASEGELETFFLSGGSYFDAMWTAPQGNAYYQLSRQYIAAILNQLDGAAVPANVQAAIDAAETLFATYTPADVAAAKGKGGKELRAQFTTLAGLLASYNEGLIGPGHCDEDQTSGSTAASDSIMFADRRTSPGIG